MTIDTNEFLLEHGFVPVANDRELAPVNLYYEIHGSGPEKVLMVMGLSTPCQAWENQTRYLAETGKYTVIIFDNRGMGKSGKVFHKGNGRSLAKETHVISFFLISDHTDVPSGLYSTSQMAHDAFDLMDHFGWTSGVHLVGISMGGMIALEMATAEPLRLKSLTLTSTCAKKNIPTLKAVTTLAKTAFMVKDPMDRVNLVMDLVHPPDWLADVCKDPTYETNRDMVRAIAIRRGRKTKLQPLHGNIGQTAAVLRHYVSDKRLEAFRQYGVPTLIVTGTWDYLVRPTYSHQMQKVLQGRFEVFEGSGHGIPEEQKEKYNALLHDHFMQASL
ncbi:alpha/beta-hydrolase [Hesseltinella vesiculosa]|uniref:Alpha/beta-hydrolase n=1 Tax=Hesseltinella vesiculosa TaxID=101127 RepID=A0A1X2G4Q1_9FUNG|nr:alpha/beta-hydrolase [Hesseltinella vesiculosa]